MRLVSYNILDGGVGRADPLAEILLAQRADVIALVEADDDVVLAHIANRLGMDFIKADGRGHAVAMLSRWPIVSTINHARLAAGGPRSLVEAVIQLPRGDAVSIFALHLTACATAAAEDQRLAEIKTLLRLTQPLRAAGRPHVLAGDFNSNSPAQLIDITKCKPATQRAFVENGNVIPRRVVEGLRAAGYTDTLAAARPDMVPTAATFTTHEPGQRVDYIFTFGLPDSAISGAWIEQDRLATYASDHYPVGAELHV